MKTHEPQPARDKREPVTSSDPVETGPTGMNTAALAGLPAILTLKEVANYLRCSERHIQNLTRFGLPHFYLGSLVRFRSAEVLDFLVTHNRIGRSRQRRVATGGTAQ